jgi:hypothetical protein
LIKSALNFVVPVGEDDLELRQFHEADVVVVAEVGKDLVLVDVHDLHDCALFNEEEVLALGPGVLGGIAKYFSLLQERLVLLIHFLRDGRLLGRVLTLIQEEVVVLVLVVDALLEQLVNLLQVGQRVHV